MIDHQSEPGAWQEALRFPHSIRVLPDTRAPASPRAETDGAAFSRTAAPDFHETPAPLLSSPDNLGGTEAHSASSVASACGYPVSKYCAVKDGNGAFHGDTDA